MIVKSEGKMDKVRNVTFQRDKYGPQLLIDVAWIHEMPRFVKTDQPYRLDFYDITLISSGTGRFCLDHADYGVEAGTVFFTSPGQVRRWLVEDLDGVCFFFPAEFILQHFNDPLFLHRLHYFHTDVGPFELPLIPDQVQRLSERLGTMHAEIAHLQADSPHLLRAIAYEVLVNLNRWFAARYGQTLEHATASVLSRYRQAVEQHYQQLNRVSEYADLLGMTPGHLNALCQRHLGRSASDVLQSRILAEAQRLLVHSQLPIGRVAERLGYADPSYFSRAFKRVLGESPRAYRRRGRRDLLGT